MRLRSNQPGVAYGTRTPPPAEDGNRRAASPKHWLPLAFCLIVSPASLLAQSSGAQSFCNDPLYSSSAACQTQQTAPQQTNLGLQSPEAQSAARPRPSDNQQVYVDTGGIDARNGNTANDRGPTYFPPDPPTDLQKLARASSGELVPVFGRDLFQRAPSTFAPGDQIPVTPDYVVGPGDEILIRLYGAEASNSELTVDTAGNIYIPKVGSVQVAGLRYSELEKRISSEVNHIFRNYRISVSLGHLRSIQVYVVGEARRPGAYTISSLSTVLNALFVSGGPNVQGSMRHIQIRRAGQTLPDFDLYDLVLRGDKSRDVRLQAGDTIFIPPVGPQAVLTGSVRHPAVYELTDGETLADLLAQAGGFSATATPSQIRLERIESARAREAVNVHLDAAGRSMALRDGDILYADHITAGYEQSVTIRGNLANPGRFAWHAGMRLSDIIPDRRSLLTTSYWTERNRLGVPVPLFEPAPPTPPFNSAPYGSGQQGQFPYNDQRSGSTTLQSSAAARPASDPTLFSQAAQPVLPPSTTDGAAAAAGLAELSSGLSSYSTPNDTPLGAAQPSVANNSFQPDFTSADPSTLTPQQYQQQQYQLGQQAQRQQTQQQATAPLNRIRIPAPEIDWSYAVIERLNPDTLKSSLVPFNLGQLVQGHDTSQDLELQPGDVVTILSQRDIPVPLAEQTKYVRLEGEFVASGVYSVGPEETLDQLIRRAGGFSPKAYLYGSSFLRESARAFQQQRLDEYISQLSTDMERATAVRAASSASGVLDPNALAEQRSLVAQLRQMRATGRIVLEFQPGNVDIATVPAITLENGDIFRVPSRPSTVSVIGAVYGQNVFLYDPRRRLDDYLALAGKTNRIADKEHAFIIRADGSIFSRERAKTVFSNTFDSARLNPGDSIVVPEKLIKPTALRQFIDYSQILSSFGLAAAAINVVR